jgi:hypothetical protein
VLNTEAGNGKYTLGLVVTKFSEFFEPKDSLASHKTSPMSQQNPDLSFKILILR